MTGIERLRELAEGLQPNRDLWYLTSTEYDRAREGRGESTVDSTLNDTLASIADQIEAEQEERVTRRLEDREAAEWVRAHGGLEVVKDLIKVNGWAHSLAIIAHDALFGEDSEREVTPTEFRHELDRRLMPEGMERLVEAWPRFEDDAPVRLLDDFERYGEESVVSAVTMYSDGSFALNCRAYSKGERVNRPAPKVLDADGVEIELGDDLYSVEGGLKLHVGVIDTRNGKIATAEMYALDKWADPAMYTHRAPVLAADGKPLREGETVWLTDSPTAFVIDDIMTREDGSPVVHLADGAWHRPQDLTHERPDSWERLEEDIDDGPCLYFGRKPCVDCPGNGRNGCEGQKAKARDLVRRARALAEKGETK